LGLNPGTRLGGFEIVALIGSGGMGEVYRARDSRLNRDVAIKVLPADVAADHDRLARFEREAQALASLNHPNIAQIHGVDDSSGTPALVMELVDGPTLADRIAEGPIPLDEALPIAKQIAEALEAAHEQGIIHRDLKPANIKVRPDSTVKVLDFGLAKAFDPAVSTAGNASMSPTLSIHATHAGIILGTAAYMSPEQASGRPVDRRADIWAFGCVLYEMLTGRRTFKGESVSETMAFVLTREVDWSALPSAMRPPIRRLLRRCLEKDRKQRLSDIADARLEIDEALAPPALMDQESTPASSSWRQLAIGLALGLIIGGIVAGVAVWLTRRPPSVQVARLIVPAPSESYPWPRLAISSDGSRLAFIAIDGRTPRLVLRPIDALEAKTLVARSVSPAEAVAFPFFSPDGQWVAFFEDNALKKVSITGGPVVTICRVIGFPLGGTWGRDDTIIFAASQMSPPGLWRVSAGGGAPVALTRPDLEREIGHGTPEFLPGGRGVLFTIILKDNRDDVAMLDYGTGRYKVIVRDGADAHYVSSGHLVYRVGDSLHAVAFDLNRTEAVDHSVPVLDSVALPSTPGSITALRADMAVAGNGTLIYVPAASQAVARTLAWFDRRGLEEPINTPSRAYTYPRLSPDGTRVALDIRDQENDIWIWDFGRKTLTRFTTDPALDRMPLWTPDGRRVVFSSDRAGPANIYWQPADGTGTAERLTQSPLAQFPNSISPDGAQLVVRMNAPGSTDLMAVSLGQDHKVRPLVRSPFNEDDGEISPDGRWLAYQSNESGRFEIYVRPFPNTESGRWLVSTDGGMQALWARNGQELFYLSPNGALMSVRVVRGDTWTTDSPMKLFDARHYIGTSIISGRTYDVSPDGQRFLMIKVVESDATSAPSQIVVVQHFDEELKRLVPVK
jgi:serine/threonine-protein kinase